MGICVGCNVWLYKDFICEHLSPDVPQRDLHAGFNCQLPEEYQWTQSCDTNDVNTACIGSVLSYTEYKDRNK